MGQYLAGLAMTATLLVPLVTGALVAKGLGDCITTENKEKGRGSANDDIMHISPRWVRNFCRKVLNMSFKRATRSKVHDHDEEKLKATGRLFLLRLAFIVDLFSIPMQLVLNMDETGVMLLPLRKMGWAPKGKKKRTVFQGKDDKRQFTLIPVISAAATLVLPFMLIWAGKTQGCWPSLDVRTRQPKKDLGKGFRYFMFYGMRLFFLVVRFPFY